MNKILSLLFLSIGLSACHKDHQPPSPKANPGGLTGAITPVAAVQTVDLIDLSKRDTVKLMPDAGTGAIKASGLNAGRYRLHFEVNPGYLVPADSAINITAGKTLALDTFTFAATPLYASLRFQSSDGFVFPASVTATFRDSTVSLTAGGSIWYHDGEGDDGESYKLTFVLAGVHGPGTYTCQGNAASSMNIALLRQALAGASGNWNTIGTGGNATITISSIDPATRVISGTFSATLIPATTRQYGKEVISNGTFQVSFP